MTSPRDAMALAALLATLAFAGCAGTPASSSTPSTTGGQAPAAGFGAPPQHAVGDFWRWQRGDGSTYTYVVQADLGSDYDVATDDPDVAFFDAQSDISTLGTIRKSDLAGSQGDERVEFFRFPLASNATWTTSWDGEPKTVRVESLEGQVAHLSARRADGSLYAGYTYDNRTGYFGELVFYSADGTVQFGSKVVVTGKAFNGKLLHWSLTNIVDLPEQPLDAAQPLVDTFDVPLGATDVYVRFAIDCQSGFVNLGVAPLPFVGSIAGTDDRGTGTEQTPCPLQETFAGSVGAPPSGTGAETWGWEILTAPTTTGTYALRILVRVLTETPVPA